jgi:hypothetical protein
LKESYYLANPHTVRIVTEGAARRKVVASVERAARITSASLTQPVRTHRRGEIHRPHHIGEQYRHLLVLAPW